MSISGAVERLLFNHKSGISTTQTPIIKNRFLSFLIWQSIQSTLTLTLIKLLILSTFTNPPFSPNFQTLISLITFQTSQFLFSVALFFISSPQPLPHASLADVSLSFVRAVFVSGDNSLSRRKVGVSFGFAGFVVVCGLAGAGAVVGVCNGCDVYYNVGFRSLGFRGFVVGVLYGVHFVFRKRWVLKFPIIQRPPFFSLKMGLPLCVGQAIKLSAIGYVISGILACFKPNNGSKSEGSVGKFIVEQIVFYIGSFLVVLCWELSHNLHQVLHTKRCVFAPPKGSAAAETNPSEPLLDTLEESTPKSLLQYLAYLDLSMVCENNVDIWRRAAFFEETGEMYRRVIAAGMKPLEQFTHKLAEGLESSSAENSLQLSVQLSSPAERLAILKVYEPFYDSQLCAWSARIISSLTARSRKEDRFGVAQLSGSNANVISALLSCLLAVETLMGKKTNIQSSHLTGAAGIKWATINTGTRESTSGAMGKIRGSPFYASAYSLADTLRTSIYCIVSAFHNEMVSSGKSGNLDKDWIITGTPLYGNHDLLRHKLRLFLDFQAS